MEKADCPKEVLRRAMLQMPLDEPLLIPATILPVFLQFSLDDNQVNKLEYYQHKEWPYFYHSKNDPQYYCE